MAAKQGPRGRGVEIKGGSGWGLTRWHVPRSPVNMSKGAVGLLGDALPHGLLGRVDAKREEGIAVILGIQSAARLPNESSIFRQRKGQKKVNISSEERGEKTMGMHCERVAPDLLRLATVSTAESGASLEPGLILPHCERLRMQHLLRKLHPAGSTGKRPRLGRLDGVVVGPRSLASIVLLPLTPWQENKSGHAPCRGYNTFHVSARLAVP